MVFLSLPIHTSNIMTHLFTTILFLGLTICSFAQASNNQNIESVIQMGHSKSMTASDISDDGKYIATGSVDRSIIIWETKTGKEIRVLHHHIKSITALHFSHDGKYILSASNDNTVKLAHVETGDIVHTFLHTKYEIANAYFNGDGSQVIIFDKRQHFSVWETHTGKLMGYFKKDYAAYNDAKTVSYNGEHLLTKVDSYSVACISLINGDTLFTMPFDKAHTLNFSNNGQYIVIGSAKLFATVFNAETGDSLHTVKTNESALCDGCKTHVNISDDSKSVYTMSNKGIGQYWNIKNGKILQRFKTEKSSPDNIILSSDNRYVLISYDENLIIYSMATGQEIFRVKNKYLDNLEIKLSAHLFLIPSNNHSIKLWSIDKKKTIKSYRGYLNQNRNDGFQKGYSFWVNDAILQYITYKSTSSIDPNNQYISFGKIDSSAIIFDFKNGKKVKTISDAKKAIFCQAYSKDGKLLAFAGGDRKIRIYRTDTYELVQTLKGHQAMIFDIEFSENPNILISAAWDGSIRRWNIETGKYIDYIELESGSPYIIKSSPNDLYIISGDLNKNIDLWESDTKTKFRSLIGHSKTISSIQFSSDNSQVLTSSWDGKIKLWHMLTGMQLAKFSDKDTPIYCATFSPNNKQIISGDGDRKVKFWDITSRKIVLSLEGHVSAVTDIKITKDGKLMVTRGANGEIIIWDFELKQQLYTYMQINRNDWLVTTPSGHFDGSKNALQLVNYVSGMEVVAIESLFDKYYTPGLAKRVMAGDKMNDTGENFKDLIKNRPELAFQIPNNKTRATLIKSDSIIISKSNQISVDVMMIENGDDISEIRIYNNGKLIKTESREQDIVFRGSKEHAKTFDIQLVDGINNLKAVAISKTSIESDPITMQVKFDGEAAKTDLYIFAIGINTYKNTNYNLNYAVKDAQDFSKAIAKGGESLFNKVHTTFIENHKANKIEIQTAFQQLIKQVGPEDVFVFYYAGHGMMSENSATKPSDFYIVTHNVTSFYGETILAKEGVSATELLDFSKDILAQKQIFILDACHSGGALNVLASRGADGREKAIAQLARNTGTFFLTASQDIQYANESGDLKHGLFTYALLEVLEGAHQTLTGSNNDNKITVNEMKTYVEERVPELSEKYHGSAQYPTSYSFGQDFPIVILK